MKNQAIISAWTVFRALFMKADSAAKDKRGTSL